MTKINPIGLLFIVFTIVFTVIGQLMVKKGTLEIGTSPSHLALLPRFIWRVFTNLYVLIGLVCAVCAAVAWAVAVSRVYLSIAYPFMGLAIVLVLAFSGVMFGEVVSMGRWLGVLIVCVGLMVAASN